jgi:hypothetical protein
MRQLAVLFGISKSAADRTIDHIVPLPALRQRKQFCRDTVLIVDGTPVPTRDHAVTGDRAVEELPLLHCSPGRHRRRHAAGRRGRSALGSF